MDSGIESKDDCVHNSAAGKNPKKPDGFVAGESKGDGVPVAHDLACKV